MATTSPRSAGGFKSNDNNNGNYTGNGVQRLLLFLWHIRPAGCRTR
jgi:hypothetical protein